MDILSILGHRLFAVLSSGALGAILGYVLKGAFDVLTIRIKRRQDLEAHVMSQIEKMAPSYYLMSNYAYLLTRCLNQYVEKKHQLQILPIEAGSTSPAALLSSQAEEIAKEALFDAGKLYRVITDLMWIEGGRYFLPDSWANQAIVDLHNGLMKVLRFDSHTLLKYIKAETQPHEFHEKLTASKKDDALRDLRDAYDQYQKWILKEDREVKEAASYARAYSDLFRRQLERLYKDWFESSRWRKSPNEPRDAAEVTGRSAGLLAETRELIRRSAARRDQERQEESRLVLSEITADPEAIAASALLNLGWNYYIAGEHALAIEEYEKSREMRPTNAVIWNNLGNAYTSKGDYEKAAQMYEEALKRDVNNAVFHANFGWMWSKRGLHDKAVECYREAIRRDPSNSYYYNRLGNACNASRKVGEAINAYSHAIALNPLDAVFYSNLADTYREQGSYEMAIGTYTKALELAPSDETAAGYYYEAGRIYTKLARWEDAIQAYEQAVKRNGTNSRYAVELIGAHRESGREIRPDVYERAVSVCQNAIVRNPNEAIHHYRLGMIFFRTAEYERALYEYDKAVQLDPSKAEYYNQLGLAYRRLERWEMVVRCYEHALRLDPEPAFYYQNLGLAYQVRGLHDEALVPLETALKKNPGEFNVLVALTEVYIYGSRRDLEKAIKICQMAIEKKSDDPMPYWLLGNIQVLQTSFAKAAEAYWLAYKHASKADEKSRLLKKIIRAYEAALEREPGNAALYSGLGRAFEQSSDLSAAVHAYRKALNHAQDDPNYKASLYNALGNVHYKGGKYESAIGDWKDVLEIAPAGTPYVALVHNNLGTAYDGLGKTDEALKHYEEAARLAPDNSVVRRNIGSAHYRQGRFRRALSEFQEACRLNPKSAEPFYNIGNCYYQMGYVDLAKGKWEEAVSRNPHFAEAFYNVGNLAYKQGDMVSAVRQWREAVTYDEKFVEAHYNLAIASFKQGDASGAIQHLQQAIAINPEFDPARRALDTIEQGGSPDVAIADIRGIE